MAMNSLSRLAGALAIAAILLPAGACGGKAPQPKAAPEELGQPVVLRILDTRDRPVAGAVLELEAVQGRPGRTDNLVSDADGEIRMGWVPLATRRPTARGTGDQVISYRTEFTYLVKAPGYLPADGRVDSGTSGRMVTTEQLRGLSREALPLEVRQVVVLRRPAELLEKSGGAWSPEEPAARRCLRFYLDLREAAGELGAGFAWPAFDLRGDHLTVSLDWKGPVWAGLSQAPMEVQMVVGSLLPLTLAAGRELAPLPGVDVITLRLTGELHDESDPYAMPKTSVLSVTAPVADLLALGAGRMRPGAFFAAHPPAISR